MKSLKGWIFFLVCIFSVWSLASLAVDNSIICPAPWEVFSQMMEQAQNAKFYTAMGYTLLRTLAGLALSFLCACVFCLAGFFWKPFGGFMDRIVVILQTIPNVAYIILLLFWTSRENTVILVIFFLLFPMMYRDLQESLNSIYSRWKDVFALYPQPWSVMVKQAFVPQMRPVISACLKSGASLAVKAGVMAEILASVTYGLGRLMQSARLNVNVAGVMGYVIWLLILVFVFEKLISLLLDFVFRQPGSE